MTPTPSQTGAQKALEIIDRRHINHFDQSSIFTWAEIQTIRTAVQNSDYQDKAVKEASRLNERCNMLERQAQGLVKALEYISVQVNNVKPSSDDWHAVGYENGWNEASNIASDALAIFQKDQ